MKLIMLIIASVCSWSLAAEPATTLDRSQVRALFDHGNQLFREGLDKSSKDKQAGATLFRDAAAAWRSISLDAGIRNSKLESNIAIASMMAGDTPRAIAAYRRAQALDPYDATIHDGLAAARRSAGTEALAPGASATSNDAGKARGTMGAIGDFLRRAAHITLLYLPERLLMISAAGLYVLGFGLLALRLARTCRVPTWAIATSLIATMFASAPLVARESSATPEGVVVATGVAARNGPADVYDTAFKEPLVPGLEVRIEERRGDWVRVRIADGRAAWIRANTLEPL